MMSVKLRVSEWMRVPRVPPVHVKNCSNRSVLYLDVQNTVASAKHCKFFLRWRFHFRLLHEGSFLILDACHVVCRVLTVAFVPWPVKPSSRISMDRSSRGDHRDALCHHQKYNSRYLGVGWGVAKFSILFIYTKLGKNLFMVNGICLQDLIVFKNMNFGVYYCAIFW